MELMGIALCALLSGGESFVDMADDGEAKEGWLRHRLGLELVHGILAQNRLELLRHDPKLKVGLNARRKVGSGQVG